MNDHQLIVSEGAQHPAPRAGIAVLALGAGAPVRLANGRGPTLTEKLFKRYSTFVEVDVGEKNFVESTKMASKSVTMFFEGNVHVRYRVDTPTVLVQRGIRDGKQAIWPLLSPILQKSARAVDGADAPQAELAAQRAADTFRLDFEKQPNGIEILAISVNLSLDADTAKLVSDVDRLPLMKDSVRSRHELDSIERRAQEDVIAAGPRAMFAAIMVKDPEAIQRLISELTQAERERYQHEIELFKGMVDRGEIESHEISRKIKEDFAESVLRRARPTDLFQIGQPRVLSQTPAKDVDSAAVDPPPSNPERS